MTRCIEMASRAKLNKQISDLYQALMFERAKAHTFIRIITKARGDALTADRMYGYWIGYWAGREDKEAGSIPDIR